MRKLISVVITAHNAESTIEKAILSAIESMGETHIHNEIIVVIDSSFDNTQYKVNNIYNQYIELIKVFNVDFSNIGKTRNFAVSKCNAKYVTMLDSDDFILNNGYADAFDYLNEYHPDLYLTKLIEVRGEKKSYNNDKLSLPLVINKKKLIKKFIQHKDIQGHFIGQFVKRNILVNNKFPEFTCYEDHFLFPKVVSCCNEIIYSNEGMYFYVKKSGSLSDNLDNEKLQNLVKSISNSELFFLGNKRGISCHWIDVYNKHSTAITDDKLINIIIKKIKEINYFTFFIDPAIRVSYKRKLIKILMEIS